MEMVCFTFISNFQKNNQSDFLMVDSVQMQDWYLVVFYGIDLLGS
jgi:hypothetical protein